LKKDNKADPNEILKKALIRNSNGAIIVSTTKSSRLKQYEKLALENSLAL
jgi:hypothetical protein